MDWQDDESLYTFYMRYWRPFGELLTDMEREGIKVDAASMLPAAERRAVSERNKLELNFRRWASSYCKAAWFMNPSASNQVATLLFGGAENPRTREHTPQKRTFKLLRTDYEELLAARYGVTPNSELEYAFVLDSASVTREVEVGSAQTVQAAQMQFGAPYSTSLDQGPAASPLAFLETFKVGVKHVEFELSSLGLTVPRTTQKG